MSNTSIIAQSLEVQQQLVASTLAAALVAGASRPHSIAEVIAITRDVRFALYPQSGSGAYEAWAKESDAALSRIHI